MSQQLHLWSRTGILQITVRHWKLNWWSHMCYRTERDIIFCIL